MTRLFVTTYKKYNDGNLFGAWLDLESYADKDAFLAACKELHKDEADPELMFPDFEGFPRALYNESGLDDRLWGWLELDEDDREMVAVYLDEVSQDGDIDAARDCFAGKFDSEEDWAADYLNDSGLMGSVPASLLNYIDYKSFANDARLGGDMVFVHHQGSVLAFRNE